MGKSFIADKLHTLDSEEYMAFLEKSKQFSLLKFAGTNDWNYYGDTPREHVRNASYAERKKEN